MLPAVIEGSVKSTVAGAKTVTGFVITTTTAGLMVNATTFDSTAPTQSVLQLARNKRLYWVVCVRIPGSYDSVLLTISIQVSKGATELCHLYSTVLGRTEPVITAGSKGSHPEMIVAAMVPPSVGLMHPAV